MPRIATRSRTSKKVSGAGAVTELGILIKSLIKENQQLKRSLEKVATKAAGSNSSQAARAVKALQGRVAKALTSKQATIKKPKVKRPITDPVALERRRAAMAKARQVRAEKRAQA
jgi:DNA-binding protein